MTTEADIRGYEGRYKIDIYGNVWRLWQHKRTKMQPTIKKGHLEIRLSDSTGRRKTHNVARLVAEHFLPKPYLADGVVHKNGNKQDAYVENLKWMSKRQIGLKFGHKVKCAKRVCKVDRNGEVVEVYHSARAAAKANYMSYQTVLDRCNGKVKSIYALDGYKYIFEED